MGGRRIKRYRIAQQEAFEWTLIFDRGWTVECSAHGRIIASSALEQFEESAKGRELVRELYAAMIRAADDL